MQELPASTGVANPSASAQGLTAFKVLLLPGWKNSDAEHWQSQWERLYGYERVQQHDWLQPKPGDWQIQLEEAVLRQTQPVLLVAHSLGCQLVSRWAAHSLNTHKVVGALLVAPPDTQALDVQHLLPGWQPMRTQRLPFLSAVLASEDDHFCSAERAQWLAAQWGADFVDVGRCGHINAHSGLGPWPQGHERLRQLAARAHE